MGSTVGNSWRDIGIKEASGGGNESQFLRLKGARDNGSQVKNSWIPLKFKRGLLANRTEA